MLKIIEYEGPAYMVGRRYRDDYIRFEWDNGFLDIRKAIWDKLSQKKKNFILKLG